MNNNQYLEQRVKMSENKETFLKCLGAVFERGRDVYDSAVHQSEQILEFTEYGEIPFSIIENKNGYVLKLNENNFMGTRGKYFFSKEISHIGNLRRMFHLKNDLEQKLEIYLERSGKEVSYLESQFVYIKDFLTHMNSWFDYKVENYDLNERKITYKILGRAEDSVTFGFNKGILFCNDGKFTFQYGEFGRSGKFEDQVSEFFYFLERLNAMVYDKEEQLQMNR